MHTQYKLGIIAGLAMAPGISAAYLYGQSTASTMPDKSLVVIRSATGEHIEVWRDGIITDEWAPEEGEPYQTLDAMLQDKAPAPVAAPPAPAPRNGTPVILGNAVEIGD
ncbi:MAG TPA: hypothetical protein VF719_12090 [Abditibacteriaceae bacterium]